jgi:cyclophilin family peptidyl-prolyl cis-trans isomerase
MTKRDRWGQQGSGRPIGVAEISPKRPHKLGAVGLAHSGDPKGADSQIYFCLNGPARYEPPNAALNGNYAVIGQVTSGMAVVQQLRDLDVIKRVSVKAPGRGAK